MTRTMVKQYWKAGYFQVGMIAIVSDADDLGYCVAAEILNEDDFPDVLMSFGDPIGNKEPEIVNGDIFDFVNSRDSDVLYETILRARKHKIRYFTNMHEMVGLSGKMCEFFVDTDGEWSCYQVER